MPSIAIIARHDNDHDNAMQLSFCLRLPVIYTMVSDYDYLLEYTQGHLQVTANNKASLGPLVVDFVNGPLGFRARQTHARKELLIRATGLAKHPHLSVLDATAGLGRDAFVMALAGAEVTLLENSPVVAVLLRDGIGRALRNEVVSSVASRLQLQAAEAIDWMKNGGQLFDVVYLDPMFPEKRKSALARKEMQYLQALATQTQDTDALFAAAKTCALKRIVVKRPRLAGPLTDLKPSHSVIGQSTRFDVYTIDGIHT